jgi:hypothetical protein
MFRLYTDASANGLAAILTQEDDEERERVILYLSRATGRTERNYGPMKLECLAVVWAITKLRTYLLGRHFEVVTDCSSMRWLLTMKEPIGLYGRWQGTLMEFDITVKYRKGKLNRNADVLSRIHRPTKGAQGGASQ